jgi:hypothetical protein
MNSFLLSFDDGNTIKTNFNGDLGDAVKYYLNKNFEILEGKNSKCVEVKEIN